MESKEKFRFIHISDTHISEYRNLLAPMIPQINREEVDFVVVTGDLVQEPTEKLFNLASNTLNAIKTKVYVLPGEYDGNDGLWEKYFGERRKQTMHNGYIINMIDTSAMGHVYGSGWGDWLRINDREQHDWLINQLEKAPNNYHFIFSHHPYFSQLNRVENPMSDYLTNNLRAIYSGHSHEPDTVRFNYTRPLRKFGSGFATVPLKFHGNSMYSHVVVRDTDEIIHTPRIIGMKKSAW